MKKAFLTAVILLLAMLTANATEPHDGIFINMANDRNLSIDQRLEAIEEGLSNNPGNRRLLIAKWDLAIRNGRFYKAHEALSKLYAEKFDSLDAQWKCYVLRDYATTLQFMGRYDRSASITIELLKMPKPNSLHYFDFYAYLQFAELNKEICQGKNLERDVSMMEKTYKRLKAKGLLSPVSEKSFRQSLLYAKGQLYMNKQKYDSAMNVSDQILREATDFNDTVVSYIRRAEIYATMGHPQLAETLYRQILSRNKPGFNTSIVVSNYVEMLCDNYRYADAVGVADEFSDLLKINASPKTQMTVMRLKALALSKLGHHAEADSIYRNAFEILDNLTSQRDGLISEDLANFNMESTMAKTIEQEGALKRLSVTIWVLAAFLTIALGALVWTWIDRWRAIVRSRMEQANREAEISKTEHLQRELTSMSLQLLNMHELLGRMEEITDNKSRSDAQKLSNLDSLLRNAATSDSAWEAFRQYFEGSHKGFIERLTTAHPSLSENDVKMCAYMMLNFTTKEIAALMYRSVRTVESIKYRLHKKLELPSDVQTLVYLRKFIIE